MITRTMRVGLELRIKLWNRVVMNQNTNQNRINMHDYMVYIAHGKHDTIIFSADTLSARFGETCNVHFKKCNQTGRCQLHRTSPAKLEANGVDSKTAIKQVKEPYLALIEADICEFIWKTFMAVKRMEVCCLHPTICRMYVTNTSTYKQGRVNLVCMRRLDNTVGVVFKKREMNHDLEADLRHITLNILEALEVLHNINFVHLDVKPSNVLMSSKDAVLADYETVVHEDDIRERIDVHFDNAIYIGTIKYTSPLLSLKVSSLFKATCKTANIAPDDPRVHMRRTLMTTPKTCDMHSLAMMLTELVNGHKKPVTKTISKIIHNVLCATDARQAKIYLSH